MFNLIVIYDPTVSGIEDCTFLYYVDCTQGICYCHLSSVTASEGCEQVSDMKAQSRDTFNPNGN